MIDFRRIPISRLFIIPLLWLSGAALASEPNRVLMVALGDSISVGTFADTSLESEHLELKSIPAFGFKTESFVDNRYSYSWSTGAKIRSQAQIFSEWFSRARPQDELFFENAAIVNSEASSLSKQLDQVFERMGHDRISEIAYVTLLSGSNDACRRDIPGGTPIDAFKASLLGALKKLAMVGSPDRKIRVLVSTLPRIADLGAPEIRAHRTWMGLSCDSARSLMNACRGLTTWKTEEEHRAASEIVERFNRAIEEVALTAQSTLPTLDLRLSRSFSETPVEARYLAADCFHPNQIAQERLAQELWLF